MSAAHTPGPWKWVQADGFDCSYLENQGGDRIHSDGSSHGEYSPQIDVNGPDARLIAAAPDLLAALKNILSNYDSGDYLAIDMPGARAAVEKAEGKAP